MVSERNTTEERERILTLALGLRLLMIGVVLGFVTVCVGHFVLPYWVDAELSDADFEKTLMLWQWYLNLPYVFQLFMGYGCCMYCPARWVKHGRVLLRVLLGIALLNGVPAPWGYSWGWWGFLCLCGVVSVMAEGLFFWRLAYSRWSETLMSRTVNMVVAGLVLVGLTTVSSLAVTESAASVYEYFTQPLHLLAWGMYGIYASLSLGVMWGLHGLVMEYAEGKEN